MTTIGTDETMGTPIPPIPPAPPGAACSVCWGIGGAFGSGPTPDFIRIQFEGIEKDIGWLPGDGEPPNGTFTFFQVPASPCRFSPTRLPGPTFVSFSPPTTAIILDVSPGGISFIGNTGTPCELVSDNLQTGKFHLGTATLLI